MTSLGEIGDESALAVIEERAERRPRRQKSGRGRLPRRARHPGGKGLVEVRNREQAESFTTLDGSTIRVLLDARAGGAFKQSLAEATLAPGAGTRRHHHARTEEIYVVLAGSGRMEVEGEERDVGARRRDPHPAGRPP